MGLENEDFSDEDQYQCMYTYIHIYFLNVPILIFYSFLLMINKYINDQQDFQQKIHTLNSENFAQNFVRLALNFFPAVFRFNEREIFSAQST